MSYIVIQMSFQTIYSIINYDLMNMHMYKHEILAAWQGSYKQVLN
jgi:hypothetical protein